MGLSKLIRSFIDTPFVHISEKGILYLSGKNPIIAKSINGGLDGKIIASCFFRVSKNWPGSSEEYFHLLNKAIQEKKLIYSGKILYISSNPLKIELALKKYIDLGIIKPLY